MHRHLVKAKQQAHTLWESLNSCTAQGDWNTAQQCLNSWINHVLIFCHSREGEVELSDDQNRQTLECLGQVRPFGICIPHLRPEVQCSAQSRVDLSWESYSEWLIYSFSSTKRPSQTGLMPMPFLQTKANPDFPFRRAKRNKIRGGRKAACSFGDWNFIVLINTELISNPIKHTHVSTLKVHKARGEEHSKSLHSQHSVLEHGCGALLAPVGNVSDGVGKSEQVLQCLAPHFAEL